jgi:hypothetical protein
MGAIPASVKRVLQWQPESSFLTDSSYRPLLLTREKKQHLQEHGNFVCSYLILEIDDNVIIIFQVM